MSSKCICQVCHCPVDCGETLCPICEIDLDTKSCSCANGVHCEKAAVKTIKEEITDKTIKIIREIKPGLFVVQKEDGKYGIRKFPDDKTPEIGSTIPEQNSYRIRMKTPLKPYKKGVG